MVTSCFSQVTDITLHDAAERGQTEIVQKLIRSGADVDAVDEVNIFRQCFSTCNVYSISITMDMVVSGCV